MNQFTVSIRFNVLANFMGRGWVALLSILVVPVYLTILGVEAYGLIGFFASLQAMAVLFDLGLGGTINRELARYSALPEKRGQARNLVRTLEYLYWGIGLVIGIVLFFSAPLFASHWLKSEHLSTDTVEYAISMMGIAIAMQWPSSLYAGGLMGLQRQVAASLLNVIGVSVRVLGSVLLIWLVEPSIELFFVWQVIAAAFQTALTSLFLWRYLPKLEYDNHTRFDKTIFADIWKFAGSLSATSMVSVALGQVDKLIVSAVLPLQVFGYYMLASTLASVLTLIPAPIGDAVSPRYAQLVAKHEISILAKLFHKACQLISGLVFPAAATLFIFSYEIIWLWTGNPEVADEVHLVASLLVLGVALGTVMSTLDNLQMAYGWLIPAFISRLAALLSVVPGMWVAIQEYGAVGAAALWLLVYVGYLVFTPYFVFRRILPSEKNNWYWKDWLSPLLISFVIVILASLLMPIAETRLMVFMKVMFVIVLAFCASALVLASYRELAMSFLRSGRCHKPERLD